MPESKLQRRQGLPLKSAILLNELQWRAAIAQTGILYRRPLIESGGYQNAAAIVADGQQFSGAGVDAERIGGVTPNLWPRLFDDVERGYLAGLDEEEQARIATLLFSAKETCHKAWGIKSALVFRDIHVAPTELGFTASRSGECLVGPFAVDGDLMLTAAWF